MKRILELAVPGLVGVLMMGAGVGLLPAGGANPIEEPTPVPEPTPADPAAEGGTGEGQPAEDQPAGGESAEDQPAEGEAKGDPETAAAAPAVDCAVLKCVALTFDDGPSPDYTPRVLDTLVSEGVPATFFMQGSNLRAYPEVAEQVAQTPGMQIANHTVTHPDLTGVNDERLRTEIGGQADEIERVTGKRPTVLRPPYGLQDETVDKAAAELGHAVVLWDVDTQDWQESDPAIVNETVAEQVRTGSIVLMHDVHATSPTALPQMVRSLKEQGYTLVTVSELLGDPEPGKVYENRVDPA